MKETTASIKTQIEHDLRAAFKKLDLNPASAVISVSTIDICDYQCNACFALAKQLKTPPMELAKKIAAVFKSSTATLESCPPAFLNFKVSSPALKNTVEQILKTNQLPVAKQSQRTIFFDYGGANIAKELHAGHLRSPIVGEALKRVFKALGHKTISDVYLGDWGLQNGLILAELEEQKFIKDGKFAKAVTLDVLNDVYPQASKKKNENVTFKKRADELTLFVQQKVSPWIELWREMRDISVARIRENYNRLNCTFDYYNGESDAQPYVKTVLDNLTYKGLAYESDNCLIMDVALPGEHVPVPKTDPKEQQRYENPMPPIILKKHNDGDLYATNDVATLYYRTKNHAPDEYVYITDARQELHFKQVFRCVKKGGIVPESTVLTHIGYGTMNGTDGKPFKTRSGGTIKLEEVTGLVTSAAAVRLRTNGDERKIENENQLAQKIGLAALKYADLSNNVRKDYIFDLDKFTSFEGKTGPYILYTIARINSIFAKIDNNTKRSTLPSSFEITDASRDLVIKTLKLADAYPAAAANYTLNGIADAAYALASAFNLFYAHNSILNASDETTKQNNLALCTMTRIALEFAMNTLAIDTVSSM